MTEMFEFWEQQFPEPATEHGEADADLLVRAAANSLSVILELEEKMVRLLVLMDDDPLAGAIRAAWYRQLLQHKQMFLKVQAASFDAEPAARREGDADILDAIEVAKQVERQVVDSLDRTLSALMPDKQAGARGDIQ